jgi:serine/threonine protein kinase
MEKKLLQRYKLADLYKQGSFGRSFLATDSRHNRLVVIKTIECRDVASAQLAAEQEPQLALLRHLHLVSLRDAIREGAKLYLVYDYSETSSLARFLKNEQGQTKYISAEFALAIAQACLSALTFLHTNGVPHGALWAENILLGETIQITDTLLSQLDQIAKGEATKLITDFQAAAKADLYQVGLLLLKSLGNNWGNGEEAQEINWTEELSTQLKALSPVLARLITGLCNPDPTKRYQTARQALNELEDNQAFVIEPELYQQMQVWADERMQAFVQTQKQLQATTDPLLRAALHTNIAEFLLEQAEFEAGIQECLDSLSELDQLEPEYKQKQGLKLEWEQLSLLTKQARILLITGDSVQTRHLVEQQITPLLEKVGLEYDDRSAEIKAWTYLLLGRVHSINSKVDLVSQFYQEALALFQLAQNQVGQVQVLLAQTSYLFRVDPQQALQKIEQASTISIQAHYGMGLVNGWNVQGQYYYGSGELKRCKLLQKQTLVGAKISGTRRYISIGYLALGEAELKDKNLDKGLELIEQALELATRLKMHVTVTFCYNDICWTLIELGRLKQALEYGAKALHYLEEFPHESISVEVRCNYALVSLWSGELVESERILLEGLGLCGEENRYRHRLQTSLIQLYVQQERWAEVEQLVAELEAGTAETGHVPHFLDMQTAILSSKLAQNLKLDWQVLLREVNALIEQASQSIVYAVLPLRILRGRIYCRMLKWAEAESDFKQVLEQAELENRRLLLAEGYYRYAKTLQAWVKQGQAKAGSRSRALGMLAQAATITSAEQTGALLLHQSALKLLNVTRQ